MLKTITLCACLLALGAGAHAAKAKAKVAEAEAPESALSEGLAAPVGKSLDSLASLQEVAKNANTKRPAAAIRKADAIKDGLKEQLSQLRDAKADEDEGGAKDAAIVAVASGLRAADLVSQGLQGGDDEQLQAGLKLADLAQGDLSALDKEGAGAGVGGGGSGTDYEIGPSMGGDFSFVSQASSMNLSGDLSLSIPLNRAMDLGVGGSLTGNSSESSSTSSSTGLGYGLNAFMRYHFLEAFATAPWAVPYLGLKIGLNYNDSYTTSGTSVTESETSSTSMGAQFGMLFFLNAKSAITAQIESGSSSSSSGGTSSPSTSTLTLSMGVRQMF